MYHLKLTLETPAENLALDEALLEAAAAGELPGDVLRLWESPQPFVVLGRSSPREEAHAAACLADGIPILRRCSGGASVVAGPGCLMYALVLDRRRHDLTSGVDQAHQYVLNRNLEALRPLAGDIACRGTSDLAFTSGSQVSPERKFSGNSLRLRRDHLLYHGTILYDFPLDRLARWLARPARMPPYRAERSHEAFVCNFPAGAEAISGALIKGWKADKPLAHWPQQRTSELAQTRYSATEW
jgi:lipoate-protein ligase A